MSSSLYQLTKIQHVYDERTILDIATLNVKAGEILAIIGPSGAGKSTLLRLLAFLERPSSGDIFFHDKKMGLSDPDLAARREISLVFQRSLLLKRTVRDNIGLGLQLRGVSKDKIIAKVDAIAEELGLTHLLSSSANSLSGGEIQRIALGRALVTNPKILLLDEPTANLDPYNGGLIEKIVRQTNEQQATTVILITHNIFQAKRLAHRVGLLIGGKIVELSQPDRFFNSQNPATIAFTNGDMAY